jgi:hypothetical protein
MPITKAVVSIHRCDPPSAYHLIGLGYLPGTEWTCDYCDAVHVFSIEGSVGPYWEKVELPTQPELPTEPDAEVAE